MDKESIQVLDVVDQEDGGAIVHFEMNEEMTSLFIRQGIRVALEELEEKYVVVRKDEWDDWVDKGMSSPATKTVDLSDQEAQGYFQIGVLKAIQDGIANALEQPGEEQIEFNFEDENNGC